MKPFQPIATERLILRRWNLATDLAPFAKLNADPRVMEFFEAVQDEAQTLASIERIESRFQQNGFSFCAAELKASGEMIGFIGLNIPGYETPFTPCVEIGWRLAPEHWGKGLAVEGARACLAYGFLELELHEIVAMTAAGNQRSRRVMEKLGMRYDPQGDFDHPMVSAGNPVQRHVLYRIQRDPTDSEA